jgi:NADH dehydrogenase FAD-containing subunit
MIPLSNLLKNGKVVYGEVTAVDPTDKSVTLSDGTSIKWDILCIASGSRNLSPAEPPSAVNGKEATKAYYNEMHAALSLTKNVVIVGGGAVSLELSGEIHTYGQQGVKITVVTKKSELLDGPGAMKPTKSGLKSVQNLFQKEGIEIIYNDEVVSEPFPEDVTNANPLVQTPNGVTLKSGKKIPCDLLVWAAGSKVMTKFLPNEWLDAKTHEVVVDTKTLKLSSRNDVFCVGDSAKTDSLKLGYFAMEDAKVVAANIMQVVQGKEPTHKITRMMMMILPFGPKKGRVLLPFTTLGDWAASSFKGSHLLVKMNWGNFAPKLTPPPL